MYCDSLFSLLLSLYLFADVYSDEKTEKTVNGEDKGDSGVETQNSEGNAEEEDPLGPNCYYDKSKSFFDNISCDENRFVLFFFPLGVSSIKEFKIAVVVA